MRRGFDGSLKICVMNRVELKTKNRIFTMLKFAVLNH